LPVAVRGDGGKRRLSLAAACSASGLRWTAQWAGPLSPLIIILLLPSNATPPFRPQIDRRSHDEERRREVFLPAAEGARQAHRRRLQEGVGTPPEGSARHPFPFSPPRYYSRSDPPGLDSQIVVSLCISTDPSIDSIRLSRPQITAPTAKRKSWRRGSSTWTCGTGPASASPAPSAGAAPLPVLLALCADDQPCLWEGRV
jgi:hypothetical protein